MSEIINFLTIDFLFRYIAAIESYYWSYIGFAVVIFSGLYLSITSNFFQFRSLPNFLNHFKEISRDAKKHNRGINPIKLIFASTGGMVGVGNVIGVGSAVLIGGPGALVWLWIGVFFGMLIKYSEIYLAMKTRVVNGSNGYDGGIMFYVYKAFGSNFLSKFVAFVLCIYAVEIYQFTVIVDAISMGIEKLFGVVVKNTSFYELAMNSSSTEYISTGQSASSASSFDMSKDPNTGSSVINRTYIISAILIMVYYSSVGGLRRITNICSVMMPLFLSIYVIISSVIIVRNFDLEMLNSILSGAVSGQSAIGGFVGSTLITTAYMGISKAVYAGDIGIGYDSVLQSESSEVDPKKQGILSMYCLFIDAFICSVSMLLVICTGYWTHRSQISPSEVIAQIFQDNLYLGDYFMIFVLFFAGFTTVISFMSIGVKSAEYISKKYGKVVYLVCAFLVLFAFAHLSQERVVLIMSLAAGILLTINMAAILKLRGWINF